MTHGDPHAPSEHVTADAAHAHAHAGAEQTYFPAEEWREFRPLPLHVLLAPVPLKLDNLDEVEAAAGVTLFDFAAVSIHLTVPLRLSAEGLRRLAGWLAEPTGVVAAARAALLPLYQRLLPAVPDPLWRDDLSEEYFVFQLPPGPPLPA